MNDNCPKCGLDLGGRWVPSRAIPEGTPLWRRWDSTHVCPSCRTPIRQNENSRDVTFKMLQMLAFACVFLAHEFAKWSHWFWLGLAIFVGVSLWRAWYANRHLADWSNWVVNDAIKAGQ